MGGRGQKNRPYRCESGECRPGARSSIPFFVPVSEFRYGFVSVHAAVTDRRGHALCISAVCTCIETSGGGAAPDVCRRAAFRAIRGTHDKIVHVYRDSVRVGIEHRRNPDCPLLCGGWMVCRAEDRWPIRQARGPDSQRNRVHPLQSRAVVLGPKPVGRHAGFGEGGFCGRRGSLQSVYGA
jgi:hypothetical protein